MHDKISRIWYRIQDRLLPFLERTLPPFLEHHQRVASILEVIRPEEVVRQKVASTGRPPIDRRLIARAFVVKMALNIETTKRLIEILKTDEALRRIVGFTKKVPSDATFSRIFEAFSRTNLAVQLHEAVKAQTMDPGTLLLHTAIDGTAIHGREKAVRKKLPPSPPVAPKKRGRRPSGAPQPEKEKTRLEVFCGSTPAEIDRALPKGCDWGCKKNSQGKVESWKGYKLHLFVGEGEIPLSAVLTSASVHDSQAAPYLLKKGTKKLTPLYTAMDAAYDAKPIRTLCGKLGIVPLIDRNSRGKEKTPMDPAQAERYKTRSTSERANALLKECFGGRHIRVRGHQKVFAHLMFGVLVLTASQILRLGAP